MLRVSRSSLFVAVLAIAGAGVAFGQPPRERPPPGPAAIAPPIHPDGVSARIIAARQAVLDQISLVTDEMLLNPPASEWLSWRRTYDVHGYSPLTEINRGNAHSLATLWSWSLPPSTTQITPLEHDGVMFVYGAGDHMQALDATNGELLWEYNRPAAGPRT